MVRRYAPLSSEHLAAYVDRLSSLKVVGLVRGKGLRFGYVPTNEEGLHLCKPLN